MEELELRTSRELDGGISIYEKFGGAIRVED